MFLLNKLYINLSPNTPKIIYKPSFYSFVGLANTGLTSTKRIYSKLKAMQFRPLFLYYPFSIPFKGEKIINENTH